MKDFLKYIPGFRSDTKWKKIAATTFYVLHILMSLMLGLDYFLLIGGVTLFLFTIVKLIMSIKNKKSFKKPAILFLSAILLFSSGIGVSQKKDIEIKKAEEIRIVEEQKIAEEKEEAKRLEEEIKLTEKIEQEKIQAEEEAKKLEEERIQAEEEAEKLEEERILAEEKAKEEEELRLAQVLEQDKIKEEELKKQEQAKKLEEEKFQQDKKAKETLAAKSNSNSDTKVAASTPSVAKIVETPAPTATKSAPAKQGVDNAAQILRTKSGKMYHTRKCGNGNFYATTLNEAKASGLTACSKCF